MNNLVEKSGEHQLFCMKLGFGMMRLPRVEGTNDIDLYSVWAV